MNYDFDVVIIGAGPVGSTIAFYLVQNDLNVAMVEKKTEIGYPLQCAGILSKHIFEYNELPDEIILNTVKGAFLHSKNHILDIITDENAAYVIDRVNYDQFLSRRAIQNGVKLISKKAIDVDIAAPVCPVDNRLLLHQLHPEPNAVVQYYYSFYLYSNS